MHFKFLQQVTNIIFSQIIHPYYTASLDFDNENGGCQSFNYKNGGCHCSIPKPTNLEVGRGANLGTLRITSNSRKTMFGISLPLRSWSSCHNKNADANDVYCH